MDPVGWVLGALALIGALVVGAVLYGAIRAEEIFEEWEEDQTWW